MLSMRTTIDIPDHVLRRAKAEAALRGVKLKDLVSSAIEAMLDGRVVRESAPEYGAATRQKLGEGCDLPLIRGADGPALPDLSGARVHEILEGEEVEDARGTARPR